MTGSVEAPIEQIEHIIRQPRQRTHLTPLFFQHGSWHGAWCWELFLDTFCSLGYEVHAISLPGHGKSSLNKGHINQYTFDDYVQSLAREIESIQPTPVVVGHSVGGAILQAYLENHRLPGAVLLATIPITGFMRSYLRMAWLYPWHGFKQAWDAYALVEKPEMAARFFLSQDTQTDIHAFHAQLVRESAQVGKRILQPIVRHPEKVTSPLLVIAGGKDMTVSEADARATAEALHARYIVFPEAPHNLMMEKGWEDVADTIDAWISKDLKAP